MATEAPPSAADLALDQAYLLVTSQLSADVGLFTLSDDCYRCPFQREGAVPAGLRDTAFQLSTKRGWRLAVKATSRQLVSSLDPDRSEVCSLSAVLGDRGIYNLTVTDSGCQLRTLQEPRNIYTPLCAFAVVLLCLAAVHGIVSCLLTKFRRRCRAHLPSGELAEKPESQGHQQAASQTQRPKSNRLAALDVFRGLTILLMIFVNEWNGQYWFFEHATWNGLLVADVVFPWFMWIMGVCIPLSLGSQIRRQKHVGKIVYHILKRSFWLLLIGGVLNSLGGRVQLETYRVPGVLQRFAATYLVVALVSLPAALRRPVLPEGGGCSAAVYDVTSLAPQWLVALGIVAAHSAITFLLPVPGCPTGYLGPGGMYDNSSVPGSCIGGATGYIDRLVVGEKHIYQHPTAKHVYGSAAFDPEGFLGVLMSCVSVFLGVQAGQTLLVYRPWRPRVLRWLAWSLVTGVIAAALCGGAQEGGLIPINKNLWSLSFTLATASLAFLLLTVIYLMVDVLGWWSGSPFFYPGRNALLMYVGHMMAYNLLPFQWEYGAMDSHWWRLAEALWAVASWLAVSVWLHEKKYFWKL